MPHGRMLLFSTTCLCLVALSPAVSPASDWTRFRGPNGTGIAADKDIPLEINAKTILWKIELPPGHSSPIVWKDHLYLQANSKDGKERMLLCLSTKDGSLIWKKAIAAKPAKAKANGKGLIHAKNTYSSSSPGVDAERVYVVFWDNVNLHMHAYTHAGDLVWSKDLGSFTSEHGAGASPIPMGDKVIFANDQDAKSVLLALDAKTGNIVWSDDRPFFRACYSSPLLRDLPNGQGKELLVVSTMGITGYDPDSGSKHWNWEWKFTTKMPLRTTGSPVYTDGMLIAYSGDGGGPRHAVGLKLAGAGPKLAWENLKDFPYVPSILAYGKYLYFVNDKGMAGCYEAATGKKVWLERLEGEFSSSPVLIDGKIYAANEEGEVFVIAAQPTYQMLARSSLGELVRATPAVADNRLYIRGQQHLFCIGKAR